MAIYHFQVKIIGRRTGRSVIAAAAYRAAEALHDAELGRTFNYLGKTGVIHSEVLLPAGAARRWLDRETLWNEVAALDPAADDSRRVPINHDPDADWRTRRRDKQLARELEFALPRELSQAEAIALARDFVREQFVDRGMIADLNIHWGQSANGEAQPHAHVMLTLRRVVPGSAGHPEEARLGLKERAWNEWSLTHGWRSRWAELANARLAEIGIDARIDHRSNFDRGIELEPQNKIGPAGARRAVRGEDAERADEHRAIARRNGERMLANPELALQVLTRQQSTFTRADLARLVHRHSDGAAQFAAIMAKVEASPELARVGQDGRGRDRYSTREMTRTERRMETAALELSQRTTHAVALNHQLSALAGGKLGAEQKLAFDHVTRSGDLAVVIGYAGSGKSTMLDPARQAWEATGYNVRGAALSGIAAEGLEAGSGITSRTIASWELAWSKGMEQLGPRDVLVLDEAGMVGSRQMERVLSAVHSAGAKLVLVGDYEQLQAIEAGAAFRAIAERVGAIEITEVVRQHAVWQREATRELARGETAEALARYEHAGMVCRHATDEAARAALIAEWQKARHQAPWETQIILAHTRDDVRALNEAARDLRRTHRELGEDRVLPTELGLRRFATGDRIYFLRNERGLGVKNGSLGTLISIEGEGEAARLTVRLDATDRKTGQQKLVAFPLAEYADLDHGYAATVHKTQGVTADRTHVLATAGMDRHLAYVALSRHRQGVTLHWSEESFVSPEGLAARLRRERSKDTTLDYGESEAELFTAYAERRGLDPAAHAIQAHNHPPVTARARLRRIQLAPELRTMVAALRHVIEAQKTTIASIAEMLTRPKPEPKQKPARDMFDGLVLNMVAVINPAPAAAPTPEPVPKVATTMAERLAALEARLAREDASKRRASIEPAMPASALAPKPGLTPSTPATADPAEAERAALNERGREAVRRWNEMEHTEGVTMKAQDWREWRKAWDGLIAYAREIKHDAPLDRLLRENGRELGIAEGSRFELVVKSSEAEIIWALKQDINPAARPSQSPSFGP